MYGTVHATHDAYNHGSAHGNVTLPPGQFFGDAFHDYAVLWEPSALTWFFDGREYFRTTKYVPSTPAYLVLDNEIGLGHLDPAGDGGWAGDPSGTLFPQTMLVDHVRVWQRR